MPIRTLVILGDWMAYLHAFPSTRSRIYDLLCHATVALIAIAFSSQASAAETPGRIDFNLQVRPILAENCLKCHGADEKQRKGKLRLDVREEAVRKKSVVPGHPEESELIKRILSQDEEEKMPPSKEHHALTAAQVGILRTWIAEGAEYKKHWAFLPAAKPDVPDVSSWVTQWHADGQTEGLSPERVEPIDAFVYQKLGALELRPAPPATKEQWLRRVSFALTGLPPTTAELDAFLADESAQSREHVVDRLIGAATFGEHLAKDWLDVARYADSYGRHEDGDMVAWPWREWVINAFNQNLSYDKFVLWQTAGDLLPNATRPQWMATAFNRLCLQSNESGNDPEEFRLDQVSDRVRANGLAFMGLTIECAKCHDHKYDPISQREYWQMAAFFDNIDENGVYSQFCPEAIPSPSLLLPTEDQEKALAEAKKDIRNAEALLTVKQEAARPRYEAWLAASHLLPGTSKPGMMNSVAGWFGKDAKETWHDHALVHVAFDKIAKEKEMINDADKSKPIKMRTKLEIIPGPVGKAMLMKGDDEIHVDQVGDFHEYDSFSFAIWLQPREHRDRAVVVARSRGGIDDGRGYEVILENETPTFALMHFQPENEIRIRASKPLPLNQWTHLAVTYDGSSRAAGMKMYINGELAMTTVAHDHLLLDIVRRKEWGDIDLDQIRFSVGGREHDGGLKNCGVDEFWTFGRELSAGEVKLLAGVNSTKDDWFGWWLQRYDKDWRAAHAALRRVRKEETLVTNRELEMMVMKELPQHRPCFVHIRGDFRQRGDAVEPDTPKNVLPFPADLPRNRLGFGQWLIRPDHPLTARVEVNRLWQMFFGRGLVGTPQDFGTRGDLPSHPQLLDWLATDFVEHGWDVKRTCRMIALSQTFGQSALHGDAKSLQVDPDNKYLSRGPRMRLSAEEVRDQALKVCELLSPKVGGRSAHPYVPPHFYRDSALQQRYDEDTGEGLYRRSMYSFWRRTLPPPDLSLFDAPSREFCVLKRDQTNTPLQALTLLNDQQFVEAQRVLAARMLKNVGGGDAGQLSEAFRRLTSRRPTDEETRVMLQMLEGERRYFQQHMPEADEFLTTNGRYPVDPSLSHRDLAAFAMVARALMSHDEALNR